MRSVQVVSQKERELVDALGIDLIRNSRREIVVGRYRHSRALTTRGAGAMPLKMRARGASPSQQTGEDSQAIVTPPALRAMRSPPARSATVSLPSTIRAMRIHVVQGNRRSAA